MRDEFPVLGLSSSLGEPAVKVVIVRLIIERCRREGPFYRIHRSEAQRFEDAFRRLEIALRQRIDQSVQCFSCCHCPSFEAESYHGLFRADVSEAVDGLWGERLAVALRQVVTDKVRTRDLGGTAGTHEFTEAVVRAIGSGD